MSKDEDRFQQRSVREGGAEHDAKPHGGEPGKRAPTDRLPPASPAAKIVTSLEAVEAGLSAVGVRYLPAMRTAIDAREMPEARVASGELSGALARTIASSPRRAAGRWSRTARARSR